MRFYGIDPNELDMDRWLGLLDRMTDVLEAENPVRTGTPEFFARTQQQIKRRARREREARLADG